MITSQALARTLEHWLGVPYLHQGRTRMGCDCIGFVWGALREAGALAALPAIPSDYVPRVGTAALHEGIATHCTRTARQDTGVLVLIKWPRDAHPTHCGILVDGDLIHCHARARAVVRHGYRRPWNSWTHSRWLLPDVDYE